MKIVLSATAKVRNTAKRVVIDGGGKVTLAGAHSRRLIYLNTCDRTLGSLPGNCNTQPTPKLVVQHIRLLNGYAAGTTSNDGGGAILADGGQFKAVRVRFVGNRCARTGPDVGGGGLRLEGWDNFRTAYVVGSTFRNGRCSNGGGLSVHNRTAAVYNSTFQDNRAVGVGMNPARPGTPGGGLGGAIYVDVFSNSFKISGTLIRDNRAREGCGALFYVSNDTTGSLAIWRSTFVRNPDRTHLTRYPGVWFKAKNVSIKRSVIR